MGALRTPREKWIDEGLRALAEGGVDAVRVEALAKSLGVTKGGFYGYFDDRDALLKEMLDTWERESTDDVLNRIEAASGDVLDQVRMAGQLTFSDDRLLPIDLAVRDWARLTTSPSACAVSTTGGCNSCATPSARSATTPTRSRPGA
jgi:AcrR family transcriptional regulator